MRILLVRTFFIMLFFTLHTPTGTYLRWYQKERKKKKTMSGANFSYFFFLIPSQA